MTSSLEDDPIHAPSLPDYSAGEVADAAQVQLQPESIVDIANAIQNKALIIVNSSNEAEIADALSYIEDAAARMRSIL